MFPNIELCGSRPPLHPFFSFPLSFFLFTDSFVVKQILQGKESRRGVLVLMHLGVGHHCQRCVRCTSFGFESGTSHGFSLLLSILLGLSVVLPITS